MATVPCLRIHGAVAAAFYVRPFVVGGLLFAVVLSGCVAPSRTRPTYAPRAVRAQLQGIETRVGDPLLTDESERRHALSLLDRVLDSHPYTYLALERRAELRLAWGQESGALEDITTLDEKYGSTAYHTALRGRALYQQGSPEEATAAFRAALELDNESTEALLHLGMILAEHRRFEEAHKYFRRVTEIDPAHRSAESYAAMMEETQASATPGDNEVEVAPADADGAWRHESDPLDLKGGGLLLLKAQEYQRATEILLSAVRGLPRDAELLRACATGFTRQGRDHAAADVLLYATAVDPDDARSQFFLEVVAARLGREDESYIDVSAQAFAAVVRVEPERSDAHLAAAKAYARRGDLEAAVTHYEKALSFGTDDPHVFLDYGLFLAAARDWGAAVDVYENGVKRHPEDQNLQANLMVAYFHDDALGKARALRKMLDRAPVLTPGARSLLAIYRGEIGR
jgi:tetratricopeptide (TPR) repeat protein